MFGLNAITENFPVFVASVVALVIAIGWHEFSHVFVAYSLGDRTGKEAGRLTLNPIKHLDPIGTLLILMGAFIGWGKPAPFDPARLRYRRYGSALVALGGPVSNLLLLFLGSIALRLAFPVYGPENLLTIFLQVFVIMNASLALFNLIPLPPLDGSWLLLTILPSSAAPLKAVLQQRGQYILLMVILADFLLNIPLITPFLYWGIDWLIGLAGIGPFLVG